MGKVIDIVKDKPRNELEAFKRWQNRWQSEMISNSRYSKKITVTDGTEISNRQDYYDSVDEDRFQQDGV